MPLPMALEQGFLALADISGYTKYLAAVELEHSHDILADLLNVVVRELTGAMELAKLEGDAVFCFTRGGRPPLLTLIEGCYRAFEERLRDIKNLTTCPCDACLRIPDLRLKFVAHHGSFVLHEVAGSREGKPPARDNQDENERAHQRYSKSSDRMAACGLADTSAKPQAVSFAYIATRSILT